MVARFPGVGDEFGNYTIERRLGRGGMGVVFAARQRGLDRTVALKVLAPELADEWAYRIRFAREATALAKLDSPHVIQVFDHGQSDGCLFIATQFVQGGDLEEWLAAQGGFSPADALGLLDQVASGLADAHAVGVIHRDIKPSNVLLRRSGRELFAYLCDFGIAQGPNQTRTRGGAVVGTLQYIAPERLEGQDATVTTDVYAMGCLLWALLTGSAPFDGQEFEIIRKHAEEPIPQLTETDPTSLRVNDILRRSMAKVPVDRYQTVPEMRADLRKPDVPTRPTEPIRPTAVEEKETTRDGRDGDQPEPQPPAEEPVGDTTPDELPRPAAGGSVDVSASPCWGWEYRLPAHPALSPTRPHPPRHRMVRQTRAVQEYRLWPMLALAGVAILTSLGADIIGVTTDTPRWGPQPSSYVLAVLEYAFVFGSFPFSAVMSWRVYRTWQRLVDPGSFPGHRLRAFLVAAVSFYFLGCIVLTWLCVRLLSRRNKSVPDREDVRLAGLEYEKAVEAWKRDIVEFEDSERRRFETCDVWFPVGPEWGKVECVIGGTPTSWNIAIVTLVQSVHAQGGRTIILDLTGRRVTHLLEMSAPANGSDIQLVTLPADLSRLGWLSGDMPWEELVEFITQLIHIPAATEDKQRLDRSEDRTLLREVTNCLADCSARTSIATLRAAISVALRDVPSAIEVEQAGITGPAFAALSGLYRSPELQYGGVQERLVRMSRRLRPLESLDGALAPPAGAAKTAPAGPADIIIRVEQATHELDSELMLEAVVALFLRSMRIGTTSADAVLIAGADRLRRHSLEAIANLTDASRRPALRPDGDRAGRSPTTLLMFEQIERAHPLMGLRGASVAFLSLETIEAARIAANMIGDGWEWRQSQQTWRRDQSVAEIWGRDFGGLRAVGRAEPRLLSDKDAQDIGKALGDGRDYAQAPGYAQRKVMVPGMLTELGPLDMIHVRRLPGGRRAVSNLDINPVIATGARTSNPSGESSSA